MTTAAALGLLALVVWLYLLLGRGGFWLARERDDHPFVEPPAGWPRVVAVVPARNEADVIAQSIESLLCQDYPGSFRIVLVDDDSDDGTAEIARRSAERLQGGDRLEILRGAALPAGWTGKLWAQHQGVGKAGTPEYLLLTDADIGHSPDNLRNLVSRAERDGALLVSLMAELSCASLAERFLIPAFIFFFQMLYPFAWVARRDKSVAAAAGGCMLVRRAALERAGGMASIRSEIIDDCALARRIKEAGAIRLGLARRACSLRPYGGLADIGHMISRSAYAQLRYSPLLLVATVAGMMLAYLAPPLLALLAGGVAQASGALAWVLMAVAFQPMLRFYRALAAVGACPAGDCRGLYAVHRAVGGGGLARPRRGMERAHAGHDGRRMTGAADFASGKGHRDENFPVASLLVRRELRAPILAFYRFARAADDVADHPTATPAEKLAELAHLEAGLRGQVETSAEGGDLHRVLQARGLSDRHALDLLEAFRRDVTKRRYADWAELMDYCRCSASPVGRFVLDVHGESQALWPANDALCNALQVINHLQDCAEDYRALARVYLPLDVLAGHGTTPEALAAAAASPALLAAVSDLARRTANLLEQSRAFAGQIVDRRLALEVGVIQALAENLASRLMRRDPLSQRVHHNGPETISLALRGASGVAIGWLMRPLRPQRSKLGGRHG